MSKIGYARVSTAEQSLNLQIDTLKTASCERIFEEKASGKKNDRVELTRCLEYLRTGDTLVIWKLDRLGRTTRQCQKRENFFVLFVINFPPCAFFV